MIAEFFDSVQDFKNSLHKFFMFTNFQTIFQFSKQHKFSFTWNLSQKKKEFSRSLNFPRNLITQREPESVKNYKSVVKGNLKINVYRLIFRDQLNIRWKFRLFVCSWETFSPLAARKKKKRKRLFVYFLSCAGRIYFEKRISCEWKKISSGKFSICCYALWNFII